MIKEQNIDTLTKIAIKYRIRKYKKSVKNNETG